MSQLPRKQPVGASSSGRTGPPAALLLLIPIDLRQDSRTKQHVSSEPYRPIKSIYRSIGDASRSIATEQLGYYARSTARLRSSLAPLFIFIISFSDDDTVCARASRIRCDGDAWQLFTCIHRPSCTQCIKIDGYRPGKVATCVATSSARPREWAGFNFCFFLSGRPAI